MIDGGAIARRIIHALQIGRATTAATDGGKTRTLQLAFMTLGNTISSITQMQHYGFASRPHAMSDHVVIAPGNQPSQTLSIASNDQRYQISLAEGEVAIHDDQGQSVHINRAGITWIDKNGNTLTSSAAGFSQVDHFGNQIVTSATGILLKSCTGVISIDNEIAGTEEGGTGATFTGTINTTGDVIANDGAAQVSLLNHTHSDAGGSGNSGPPVPGT
jgi:phage gp45-like